MAHFNHNYLHCNHRSQNTKWHKKHVPSLCKKINLQPKQIQGWENADRMMTTGVWTPLRVVALFGPQLYFLIQFSPFYPSVITTPLNPLKSKENPSFLGRANPSQPLHCRACHQGAVSVTRNYTSMPYYTYLSEGKSGIVGMWREAQLSLNAGHSRMD